MALFTTKPDKQGRKAHSGNADLVMQAPFSFELGVRVVDWPMNAVVRFDVVGNAWKSFHTRNILG